MPDSFFKLVSVNSYFHLLYAIRAYISPKIKTNKIMKGINKNIKKENPEKFPSWKILLDRKEIVNTPMKIASPSKLK